MPTAKQTIRCPECDAEVPLDEALSHRVREEAEAQLAKERLALKASRAKVAKRELELEDLDARLDAEVDRLLAERVGPIREQAEASAAQKSAVELEHARAQLATAERDRDDAKQEALAGLQAKAAADRKEAEIALTVAREVAKARTAIAEAATREAGEAAELRIREHVLTIDGMKEQIEELKRRAEQGSQQTQGEALELQLEAALRDTFPADEIEPIPKGHKGADALQHVRSPSGRSCGTICWEYKQTKNWNAKWVGKLKDDQRARKADVAVLVSVSLPAGTGAIDERDGVWVCAPGLALAVAALLRKGLIEVTSVRALEAGRSGRADALYSYLTSPAFRQRLEALADAFAAMSDELAKEKRAMHASWSRREAQIDRVMAATSGLYGDVGGRLGAALPPVEQLELPPPLRIDEPDPEE